jgi:hypothetical protein
VFVVNLGEQLLSEPHPIGANEKTKDHTRTAAAPGELGQIVGYRTKKDRPTGYADLFHDPSITQKRLFATHGLTRPAHLLRSGWAPKEAGCNQHPISSAYPKYFETVLDRMIH